MQGAAEISKIANGQDSNFTKVKPFLANTFSSPSDLAQYQQILQGDEKFQVLQNVLRHLAPSCNKAQ